MMAGGRWIAALVVGVFAVTGTALGAGWGTHAMTRASMQPMGVTRTGSARHEFRGQITYVSQKNWFRMRTNQGRMMRIGVGNATNWTNCNWDAMRAGRHVDVHAVHHAGSWMATGVSPWMGNWNDHWSDMDDHMGGGYGHMGSGMGR